LTLPLSKHLKLLAAFDGNVSALGNVCVVMPLMEEFCWWLAGWLADGLTDWLARLAGSLAD
jgi:hypothetical protein